jgi:hypothetical protein
MGEGEEVKKSNRENIIRFRFLNSLHEGILGSRGIAALILNLGTRWR